jgi:hypothetical protein
VNGYTNLHEEFKDERWAGPVSNEVPITMLWRMVKDHEACNFKVGRPDTPAGGLGI